MRIVNIQSYDEICEILRAVGVDPYGIGLMANKACHVNVLVSDQSCKVANILKQEMLSLGADAVWIDAHGPQGLAYFFITLNIYDSQAGSPGTR